MCSITLAVDGFYLLFTGHDDYWIVIYFPSEARQHNIFTQKS